jgi:hypothetical protein
LRIALGVRGGAMQYPTRHPVTEYVLDIELTTTVRSRIPSS